MECKSRIGRRNQESDSKELVTMSEKSHIEFWKKPLEMSHKIKLSKFISRFPKVMLKALHYILHPKIIAWYLLNPRKERYSYYDNPQPNLVLKMIKASGLSIQELNANDYLPGFQDYLERTREIYRQSGYFRLFDENGYFFEKALEHYLSLELLGLSKEDAVLDVGTWGSPFASIAERERMHCIFSRSGFQRGR